MNNTTKYRFTPKPYHNGEMDFYRLMDSLQVRPSPEVEHALKKLLFSGARGHKSEIQDLQESVISIEMRLDYLSSLNQKEN